MFASWLLAALAATTHARVASLHRRASKLTAARSPLGAEVALPSSENCTWRVFNQTLDHFAVGSNPARFGQRLCLYDGFVTGAAPRMVWFYTGNESPVEEYVNNTGLMWETGAELGALLVWAEHRYEGGSVPACAGLRDCLAYASVEQALADYAVVIDALRAEVGDVPFVAVGGSYGGMLSSWFRFKYPTAVVGAIAGSAVWGFADAAADGSDFARTASPAADGTTALEAVAAAFDLCEPLASPDDVAELVQSVQGVFFDLAEANYPFPSTYITSAVGPGEYPLPAWPMRAACATLEKSDALTLTVGEPATNFTVAAGTLRWDVAYDAVAAAAPYSVDDAKAAGVLGVFRGVTGTKTCLPLGGCATGRRRRLTAATRTRGTCARPYDGGSWDPVCCNDDLNLVNYLVQGVGRDFYWPPNVAAGATLEDLIGPPGVRGAGCSAGPGLYGYQPTSDPWSTWLHSYFGGKGGALATSNVVFSNGLLDPWSAAGVYADDAPLRPGPYVGPLARNVSAADDVTALIIPLGAHHLDLMFMDDDDPPCARFAREFEVAAVRRWTGLA
ncbi:dipeptidyl-peptidase [Aureococcus anophagefferens]|nr:dipeptidyl-peptidase [Aureococcus anophagefferens]